MTETVAQVRCGKCETPVVVFPPTSGSFKLPAEAPPIVDLLGDLHAEDGSRFTTANEDGRFACPACGGPGYSGL